MTNNRLSRIICPLYMYKFRDVSTAQTKKFWTSWQTFETLLFVQSRHSKLYCLCNRDIQNFIVCAVATFKTLFVQSRHSKLYCLCSRDIQNFIVCAIATFKTLLFVQSSHSKLFSLRVPSGAPYDRLELVNTNFKNLSSFVI